MASSQVPGYVPGPKLFSKYFIIINTLFAFDAVVEVLVKLDELKQIVAPPLTSCMSLGINLSEPLFLIRTPGNNVYFARMF